MFYQNFRVPINRLVLIGCDWLCFEVEIQEIHLKIRINTISLTT
jgi:hypothetical protein